MTAHTTAACGYEHTVALDATGSLWASGHNGFGQLGTGDTENRLEFTRVELPERAVAVACGSNHTVVVDDTGALWVAGRSDYGQLGAGRFNHLDRFARVEVGTEVAELAAQLTGTLTVEQAYESARSALACS